MCFKMKYYTLKEVNNELLRIIKGENLGYNIVLDHTNDLYYKI